MARGYTITVTLKDGQNRLTTLQVTLASSVTTISAAQTALDAYLDDFVLASGLGVESASMTVPMTVDVTTPQTQSNFDEGAKMSLRTTDGKLWSFRIPGPIKDPDDGTFTYITGGEVDTADSAITGLFANYLVGGAFRFGDVAQQVLAVGGISSGVLERA